MFFLEMLGMVVSFLVALDTCWARRKGMLMLGLGKPQALKRPGMPGSQSSQSPRFSLKSMVWAMMLGGSVTLRLVCALQLSEFHATVGSTLAASCWVSAWSSLLSFLCLYPFLPRATWETAELGELTELATVVGALSLPAFLAVAAMDLFGLGFAQMMLLLVAVSSGALMADSEEVRKQSLKILALALGAGLLAVAHGWPSSRDDVSKYSGPIVALLVAGVSAVVQAGVLVDQAMPATTAKACELSCHFASAMAHMPFLLVFILSGDSFKLPRLADAHFWVFIAAQGVFYLRSLRPLTMALGRAWPPASTLSLVLLGQLLTTFMMDTLLQDAIPARLLNVSMVLFGVLLTGGGNEQATVEFEEPVQNTLNFNFVECNGNANHAV
ncbi:unnamed protein product [Symbiodinium sp. CCMP2456]|nr:unnamed protein product [Symbiodinium sp. CCMP2456]